MGVTKMKLFGTMKVEDNQLTIGGNKAVELIKEYGSPLYVFDEDLIREYCRDYRQYFRCKENNNRVAFAGKAFLTVQMCKLLMEENMSLDVVSGGELYTAYKAGFPLERVMFHGNNKTLDEIERKVKNIDEVDKYLTNNYEKTDKFFKDNMCINLKDLKIKLAFKTGFQVELETM